MSANHDVIVHFTENFKKMYDVLTILFCMNLAPNNFIHTKHKMLAFYLPNHLKCNATQQLSRSYGSFVFSHL